MATDAHRTLNTSITTILNFVPWPKYFQRVSHTYIVNTSTTTIQNFVPWPKYFQRVSHTVVQQNITEIISSTSFRIQSQGRKLSKMFPTSSKNLEFSVADCKRRTGGLCSHNNTASARAFPENCICYCTNHQKFF